MKLEEQLRTLRQEKGLSQAELAEMLDVSRQAVSRWETGTGLLSMDALVHGGISAAKEQEHPEQAERRPGGRKIAAWAAAVLCLLALAVGICIGCIAAPKEEDNEIILMEDMKGEEVERIPENTFATESLQERG